MKHESWAERLIEENTFTKNNVEAILQKEIGLIFLVYSRRRVCLKEQSKGKQHLNVSFKHSIQAGDELMIEQVRTLMEEKQLDGVLIQKRNNFSWLTGGRRNHIVLNTPEGVCQLLVLKDDIVLVVNQMEEKRIIEEEMAYFDHPFQVVTMDWFEDETPYIQTLIKDKRIGADIQMEGVEWIEPDLSRVRSILSAPQLSQYETLCHDTAVIVESVCQEIVGTDGA